MSRGQEQHQNGKDVMCDGSGMCVSLVLRAGLAQYYNFLVGVGYDPHCPCPMPDCFSRLCECLGSFERSRNHLFFVSARIGLNRSARSFVVARGRPPTATCSMVPAVAFAAALHAEKGPRDSF